MGHTHGTAWTEERIIEEISQIVKEFDMPERKNKEKLLLFAETSL